MSPRTRVLVFQLVLLAAVCLFLFYYALGALGLVGADEPRYAQIAREMLDRHDWVVPTLNGSPWLEKPVLLYWKIIVSFKLFEVQDWVARLPAASHAILLVLVVFFFMRRFRPGSELDAGLITASCAAVIGFARGASTDMLLSAPLCIALLAWWAWHETGKRFWLVPFYALLAAGMLAKGPIAPVLAVLIVGIYALIMRDLKIFLRGLWWPGILLFLIIALPWYILIQTRVPQFFRTFFIEHNLERFGTNLYRHSQPFWYYIPVFVAGVLPWTIFVLQALFDAGKNLRSRLKRQETTEESRLPVFLLIWALAPIILFSISRSKLPGYILPAIPAAAILAADFLHRSERPVSRWTLMLHSLVCGGLVGGALLAPSLMLKVHPTQQVITAVAVGAGVMATLVLLIVRRGGVRLLHFATLLPVVVSMGFLLRAQICVEPVTEGSECRKVGLIDATNSARPVADELSRAGALREPQLPVSVFNVHREVEYGLNFYLNRPIGNYERDGVPAGAHVLVTKLGSRGAVQALAGNREIRTLGEFLPQHLEFFLVSNVK